MTTDQLQQHCQARLSQVRTISFLLYLLMALATSSLHPSVQTLNRRPLPKECPKTTSACPLCTILADKSLKRLILGTSCLRSIFYMSPAQTVLRVSPRPRTLKSQLSWRFLIHNTLEDALRRRRCSLEGHSIHLIKNSAWNVSVAHRLAGDSTT